MYALYKAKTLVYNYDLYFQHNLKETINLENNLRNELRRKEGYIEELEQKQAILEQQLQKGLDYFLQI